MHFPHDPVGLLGLVALGIGFAAFLVALVLARRRGAKACRACFDTAPYLGPVAPLAARDPK